MEGRRLGILRLTFAQIRHAERVMRETAALTVEQMLAQVAGPSIGRRYRGYAGAFAGYNEVNDRLSRVAGNGGYKVRREDAETLLTALRNEKASRYARLCAARFLLELDSPEARRYVDACISGSDARLLCNAVTVLLARPDREWAAPRLIKLLESSRLDDAMNEPMPRPPLDGSGVLPFLPEFPEGDESDHRERMIDKICERLADIDCREAVPAMIALVRRDPDFDMAIPYFGASVVGELRKLAGERAIPVLVETLRYPDGEIRERHFDALLQLGWPPAVVATLDRPAIRLIDTSDPTDAPELLRKLRLAPESKIEVSELFRALGRTRDRRAVAPLLELAQSDGHSMVRAVGALKEIGGDEAIRGLVRMLDRDPRQWRRLDVQAMFKFRSFRWATRDQYLPEAIGEALEHLTGQEFGTDPESWKAWLGRR